MSQVKQGSTVRVHYVGTLQDGTVFDSSGQEAPLEFKVGDGQILPAFEQELVGMSPGEKKEFTVAAKDGFGDHRPELVRKVERSALDVGEEELEVGVRLRAMTPEQMPVELTVTGLDESTVTLDANHPLAGRDLHFEVQLLEAA